MMNWDEYDKAAEWCAKRGIKGDIGDPLPMNMSNEVFQEITNHPEEFQERIKLTAYAIAEGKE